jgi:hypothetical protein
MMKVGVALCGAVSLAAMDLSDAIMVPSENDGGMWSNEDAKFSGEIGFCPEATYPFGYEVTYRSGFLTSFRLRCGKLLSEKWDALATSAEGESASIDDKGGIYNGNMTWEFVGMKKMCPVTGTGRCLTGIGSYSNTKKSYVNYFDSSQGKMLKVDDVSADAYKKLDVSPEYRLVGFETALAIEGEYTKEYISDIRFYYVPKSSARIPDLKTEDGKYFQKSLSYYGDKFGMPSACSTENIPPYSLYVAFGKNWQLRQLSVLCPQYYEEIPRTTAVARQLAELYGEYVLKCGDRIRNITLYYDTAADKIQGVGCNGDQSRRVGMDSDTTELFTLKGDFDAVYGTAFNSDGESIDALALYGLKIDN